MSTNTVKSSEADAPNWWILVTVGVGTFMSALDGSVANTVLPVLRRALHSDVASVEWVVTAYLLVTSGLLLSAGRWGDLHGHKPIYQAGFVVFIGGSALCGLAPSIGALIGCRALQAVGAALLQSSSAAIVTRNFPASRRGQALGLQATLTYLGICAGPLLGGWLATRYGWRAVFTVNVPIGLVALALSQRFVPVNPPAAQARGFDIPGAALFLVGLVSLILALDQGQAWGWASPAVLGLLAVAALCLAGFARWEGRVADPMLDLRLFRDRAFTAATVSATLNFASLSSLLFLLPFYLIGERGLTAARAGLTIAALPVAMALVAPWSGALSDRVGTSLPATAGMGVLALGTLLLTRLGPHTALPGVAGALAVAGVGVGVFLSPNNSALMGAAPRAAQGVAAGVRATARNLGNVLGVGVTGAVYGGTLAHAGAFPAFHAGLVAVFASTVLGALTSAARGRYDLGLLGRRRSTESGVGGR